MLKSMVIAALLLTELVTAQGDSLPGKTGMDTAAADTLANTRPVDSLANKPADAIVPPVAGADTLAKKSAVARGEPVNILQGSKKVRAFGWGEYRVGGRCLCCDNMNDNDCIIVQTVERTDRERITQIIDGKIEGDADDPATYFGNVQKRDYKVPVTFLMAEISLGKMQEIRKVVVHTLVDKKKRTNYLSNCELGYYDQFNRLQWVGKAKPGSYDKPVIFEIDKPVLTAMVVVKVVGGKNRITEVAVFGGNKKE